MTITETDEVSKRSTGMKQVMQALLDLKEASTDEIVDHNEVEIKESQGSQTPNNARRGRKLIVPDQREGKIGGYAGYRDLHTSVRLP